MCAGYTRRSMLLVFAAGTVLLSTSAVATEESSSEASIVDSSQTTDTHLLPSIQVEAAIYESLDQGTQTYHRDLIQALPSGNGDITSVLKLNPSVQFDDTQLSSKTPGEIDPANISINGAVYWQNLFLLDGVSMNNDLDPVSSNPLSMTDVPGRSQGLALDTDLVGSIEVLDSNVSAEFGGFNGGVVNVTSRAPAKRLSGKISIQHTSDAWTQYHIDESQLADMETSTSAALQPEFSKWITRATLEGPVNDELGLLFSFSRKDSTIPLYLYDPDTYATPAGEGQKDQERRIDNYFVKAHWTPTENLVVDASLTHAPQENLYFISNGKDTDTRIISGGYSGSIKVDWTLQPGLLSQTFGFSDLENSRETLTDYYRGWRWSPEKNWSNPLATDATHLSSEGSWGDIEQQQRNFSYKANMDWNALYTGSVEHRIKTGVELGWQQASYQRPEEMTYGSLLAATTSCIETVWCSMSPTPRYGGMGQAFRRLNVYEAGEIEYETTQWSAYLEDALTFGRLQLRPGVRFDADSFMDDATWSPRFAAELDLWGDRRTRLSAGANRYYGRNMHAYRLNEGRTALQYTQTRTNGSQEWGDPVRTLNNTRLNELKLPYDDELMLGLDQQVAGYQLSLKYVHRDGKDQIVRARSGMLGLEPGSGDLLANYFTYNNQGSSTSETLTLTFSPMESIRFRNTEHHFQLALDWTDVTRSHRDYSTTMSSTEYDDPYIRYDGRFMRYSERPADNFNRPWTARLTTVSSHPASGLTLTNFLRYRAGYRAMGVTGDLVEYQGGLVDVWEENQYKESVNWDMRLGWEKRLSGESAVFANLDVYNLLDKVNLIDLSNSDVPTYETGRQVWLEVGYSF
ncbi:TonB-dependent receptor plug domain-containing protein [Nitrincola sp.]|uniref:TonB-dependent receptor plug domain-containing protein n=1 Tax=Nitrincola sp. TaxID=1926584 RepID=UPI003A92C26E